jgi:hypothetical protein
MPRSEFVLTALTYPLMVGLRGLGERAYHGIIGKVLPMLTNEHEPKHPPAIEDFARVLTTTLRTELLRQGVSTDGVRLQVEPGRWLYGVRGASREVKVVKRPEAYPYAWVLTDTTYFFLAGGTMDRNRYPLVADRADAPRTFAADIVGHSCFADIIILGAHLRTEPGDVIPSSRPGYQSPRPRTSTLPRPGLGPGPRRRGPRWRVHRRRVGATSSPNASAPAEDAQPDLAVTEDVATWVVAGLQVVAAVAFTGFWLTWRREPHDEPWLPDGYVEHEEVFVFPDVIVAITLVVSAVLLVLEEPFRRRSLIAAGARSSG